MLALNVRYRPILALVLLSASFVSASICFAEDAPHDRSAAPSRRIEELTFVELADAIRSGNRVVLVYSGGVEESGPHMVLGKHNIRAHYFADQIAARLGNAMIAPIVPFSTAGQELTRFPGTINVRDEVLAAVYTDYVESLVRAGFQHVILLGDHAGSQKVLERLAPQLDRKYQGRSRVLYSSSAYTRSQAEMQAYLKAHHFPPSSHGGVFDTSQTWAIDAAAIRADKIAKGDPYPAAHFGPTGVEGDPRGASPELGRLFNQMVVDNGVTEIKHLVETHPVQGKKEVPAKDMLESLKSDGSR